MPSLWPLAGELRGVHCLRGRLVVCHADGIPAMGSNLWLDFPAICLIHWLLLQFS